jgi:WD40 repeat protein
MKLLITELFLTFTFFAFNNFCLKGQVPELILPIGHSDRVRDASYSPDGRRISTTSDDRTVKIWNAENGRLLLTLDGFNSFEIVSTVTFSPDGKSIMTINEVGAIRIWDSNSGKLLLIPDNSTRNTVSNVTRNADNVKFSPDGKYLFVIQDTVLNIWDIRSGKLHRTLCGNKGGMQSFNFSPDKKNILSSSGDGSVKIWDAKSFNLIRSLERKIGISDFSGAIFTPDGKNIMTLSNGELNIWDPVNGDRLITLSSVSYSKPCFSPDSKKILAIGDLYNRNGKWKKSSEISLSFSVDSGGLWGQIPGLYDAASGKLIRTYIDSASIDPQNENVGNQIPTNIIGFSPDGKNIITVSDKCRIWDTEKGIVLYTIDGQFDDNSSVSYTPDSKRILIITHHSTGLYDAENGRQIQSYDAPIFRIYNVLEDNRYVVPAAGLSPDGKCFYIISGNHKSVKIWDAQKGELKLDLIGNSSPVAEAVFSPDGKYILSKAFYKSSTAKIWDMLNGKILQSFEGQEWSSAKYCDGGKNLNASITTGSGKTIINKWDAINGKKLNYIELQADSVIRCIFSPDNTTVVVIDTNYNAKILDAKTGAVLHKLTRPVGYAKYNPDGKSLLTTSWFDFINLWDVVSGRLINTFRSNNESDSLVFRLAGIDDSANIVILVTPEIPFDSLSYQGKMLVTGSIKKADFSCDGNSVIETGNQDFVSRMWNTQNGALLNSFAGNKATITTDGTKILTFDFIDNETAPVIRDVKNGKTLYHLEADLLQICTASFSPDGQNVLTANNDSVKIWDAQNGQLKRAIYFSGNLYDIDWNGNKIMIHDNSKLVFFDLVTGKKLYTFLAIDSADYLVLTADNYYMGTKNATSKLSWRVGNQLYSFDQFDLQYNRPDIVLERLGNTDTALIKMYRSAYEKRLRKSGFNEKMFSTEWHTPEINILDSDSLIYTPDKSGLQLKICGTDSRYVLNRLQVWVNGVPIYGANGLSLLKERTDSIVKTINIRLSAGDNNIKVSCMNEKGVESLKESFDIVYNPQSPVKPDLYIIAMSVSDYKDKKFDLQYAAKDGKDIAKMFDTLAISRKDFRNIIIDTLLNYRATRKNFFSLKNELLASNVDDQVVVFVSGHGLLNKDMDFYFATYDIDFRNPEKKGISFDNLENILDSIPARKKLLMMDACHSGEVDKEEINDLIASNTVNTPGITFRGNVREYNFKGVSPRINQSGISLSNSFELMQELFAGLDQGTGTTVISAAAGRGYALESPQWNNGVFTYSIINGLKNRAADKNRDGVITISELKDYSIKEVQLLTGGKQKPTARRESINYDWIIR